MSKVEFTTGFATDGTATDRARRPSIRPATSDDLTRINCVVDDALRSWVLPERVLRLAPPSFYYDASDLAHMALHVLDLGDGMVPAVVAWEIGDSPALPNNKSALLLHGLYVAVAYQRRGIGTELLDRVFEEAKTHAVDGIAVRAWRESAGFFLTRNFEPIEPQAGHPRRLWRAQQ